MSWLVPSLVKTVVNTGINGKRFSDIFIAITDYGHIAARSTVTLLANDNENDCQRMTQSCMYHNQIFL